MSRDLWWLQPAVVFTILTSFVVDATWAAFQNAHYHVYAAALEMHPLGRLFHVLQW